MISRTFMVPWRPPSQVWWCEIVHCTALARRNTPLGAYCAKHSAALAEHYGWTAERITVVGRGGRSGSRSSTSPLAGASAAGHECQRPAPRP